MHANFKGMRLYSQGALVLEVLVQEGPSALIDEDHLYLK